jgi:hypothetical protein
MAVDLVIPVPDVDIIYGAAANQYNSIRLYRSSTRGGPYTLITTISLTPGDTVYPYVDAGGTASSWYKVTFYNSTVDLESDINLAEPFPATRPVLTRKELRQKIVTNLGGLVFTLTDAGTTDTFSHHSLAGLLETTGNYVGWAVFRPSAEKRDQQRTVEIYSPPLGRITVDHPYDVAPAIGETIEMFPIPITLSKLNEKINDGLEDTRFLYRLELGMTSGQLQYPLPAFVEGPEYVHRMWRRMGPAGAYVWRPIDLHGRFARVRGSHFQCVLDVDPAFGENEVIALEVWRPGERLESDDDFTYVPLQWAEAAAMKAVLEYLIDIDTLQNARPSLYERLHARWSVQNRKMARKYGPTPGMILQPLSRITGLPEV